MAVEITVNMDDSKNHEVEGQDDASEAPSNPPCAKLASERLKKSENSEKSLEASEQQDSGALLEALYGQLRVIARRMLRGESKSAYRTSDLVQTALRRFIKSFTGEVSKDNEQQVVRAICQYMRTALIDQARRRDAKKRGEGVTPRSLSALPITDPVSTFQLDLDLFLDLNEALEDIKLWNEDCAQVGELLGMWGLPLEVCAKLMKLKEQEAKAKWLLFKARLAQRLPGFRDDSKP